MSSASNELDSSRAIWLCGVVDLRGSTVLVTGAAGFIGSHLVERLVKDGAAVRAFGRYTSRTDIGNLRELSQDVLDEVDVRFGDLLDRDFVGRAVAEVDVVFHLGASISVAYSYVAPREVVQTNVIGTLNVLTAAQEAMTRRVVQMSSSEVYGTAQYTPIDEKHPLHAQSPYAASKVGADKLAETFHLSFGLPVVIARPFNTYGPRQSQRAVIPTIVAQALAGGELSIGATTPRRDFVYVGDTVDALLALGASDDHAGETFNISTGTDVSVAQVVELVGEFVGRELTVRTDETRLRPENSEVFQLLGTAEKLTSAYGWKPRTPVREGIRAVVDWMAGLPTSVVEPRAV
jgi:NAD dependent epimerase/dehydratase